MSRRDDYFVPGQRHEAKLEHYDGPFDKTFTADQRNREGHPGGTARPDAKVGDGRSDG